MLQLDSAASVAPFPILAGCTAVDDASEMLAAQSLAYKAKIAELLRIPHSDLDPLLEALGCRKLELDFDERNFRSWDVRDTVAAAHPVFCPYLVLEEAPSPALPLPALAAP
jgi:hypothetical protein